MSKEFRRDDQHLDQDPRYASFINTVNEFANLLTPHLICEQVRIEFIRSKLPVSGPALSIGENPFDIQNRIGPEGRGSPEAIRRAFSDATMFTVSLLERNTIDRAPLAGIVEIDSPALSYVNGMHRVSKVIAGRNFDSLAFTPHNRKFVEAVNPFRRRQDNVAVGLVNEDDGCISLYDPYSSGPNRTIDQAVKRKRMALHYSPVNHSSLILTLKQKGHTE